MKKEIIIRRWSKEEPRFFLSEEEISHVLKHTKRIKHRILLELIYECGLSIDDVLSLKYSDIDLINGELTIGNSVIILPSRLINLLRYQFSCEKYSNYVLETSHGKMSKDAAEKIIQTLALQAINKPINSQHIKNSKFEHRDLLLESKLEEYLPLSSYGRHSSF